jgi:LAO/AO transport system kinase
MAEKKTSQQNINPNLQIVGSKPLPSAADFVSGITAGDRVKLSQAITLIESTRIAHTKLAQKIVEGCLPFSGKSLRIGITGAPGVGKSSFIESFGTQITQLGRKIAVLAIDPSSQISRGSILGDKTRMQNLSSNPNAFIRPSPAGTSLGGVATKTRESIVLCEAAGFDTIIVETVGVGQSETVVHSMTDFFLYLILPGAGDELQGIKRGIVEMADLVAVNKADGDRIMSAKQAKAYYKNALHLFPQKSNGWTPKATICSTVTGLGIAEIWQTILAYQSTTKECGFFDSNRQAQSAFWLKENIQMLIQDVFINDPEIKLVYAQLEANVLKGVESPYGAASQLLEHIFRKT